jgi:hypothetical protein
MSGAGNHERNYWAKSWAESAARRVANQGSSVGTNQVQGTFDRQVKAGPRLVAMSMTSDATQWRRGHLGPAGALTSGSTMFRSARSARSARVASAARAVRLDIAECSATRSEETTGCSTRTVSTCLAVASVRCHRCAAATAPGAVRSAPSTLRAPRSNTGSRLQAARPKDRVRRSGTWPGPPGVRLGHGQ